MTHSYTLDIAWLVVRLLKFGGLAALLCGVCVFGWYFVQGNARAAQGDSGAIPRSSWSGRGPVRGMLIVGAGVALTCLAIALAAALPSRV